MDLKAIKQIVDLMKKSELTHFEIEEEKFKLSISRDKAVPVVATPHSYPPVSATPNDVPSGISNDLNPSNQDNKKPTAEEVGVTYIKSPMVGTFYRAPSPDAANFAEIDDLVSADTVVCIIEAMKVMNEIQADLSGKVLQFLVNDGDAVEFGQNLIKIKT